MRLRTTGCVVLALLVWSLAGTGCSKNEPAEQQAGQASGTQSESPAAEPQAPGTTTAQKGEAVAGGEVTLAGTLGCGHCTYHVTPECSPCIKTAAGAVYVIDGAGEGSELMEKRFDALEVSVAGTVVGSEEPKHIAMTSYTIK
jgi:hypothetical protein